MSTNFPIVRVEKICKKFGSLEVLKGIDLEIEKGKVACITGPSGAGKTTLLQIMGSLERPDSGKILIGETDILALPEKKLADFRNRNMGFVFQFHFLLPEFTALENIMMPALIAGESREQAEKKALELLGFMGLEERRRHKPSELSGGEQQRIAVARALINHPEIIFADEPSGNLDSQNAQSLHQLFFDLRDTYGQSFVIVTHNPELAAQADLSIRMKNGEIER